MPRIDKKYIKVGVVGLAAVALVVGLSVGLTRGKSNKNASAAAANRSSGLSTVDVNDCVTYSGKSGKSGSYGGSSGRSGKSGAGRMLVVPGMEDYLLDKEEASKATEGQHCKLGN